MMPYSTKYLVLALQSGNDAFLSMLEERATQLMNSGFSIGVQYKIQYKEYNDIYEQSSQKTAWCRDNS